MPDFFPLLPLQTLKPYAVRLLDGGKITVLYPDGWVISVQPDGSIEKRKPGTDGAYEQAERTDKGAIYQPLGPGTPRYLLPGVLA